MYKLLKIFKNYISMEKKIKSIKLGVIGLKIYFSLLFLKKKILVF